MSILLIGIGAELGDALIPRLVDQGDEVRALENDAATADRFRSLGAYIAHGDATDPDLVMRAATGCRTLVAAGDATAGEPFAAALEGAARAGVERVIMCETRLHEESLAALRRAGTQYVTLELGRRGLRGRPGVAPENVAAAVDAADDLGGHLRLELDLRDAAAWDALGLRIPGTEGKR